MKKSKTYKNLSSSDSDYSLQGTSKFREDSSFKKKIPLSIEISSDSSDEDKENKSTLRNYKAIIQK